MCLQRNASAHGEGFWLTLNSGIPFITNGSHKYVYYPGTGKEQFFDLQTDRDEMTSLI